MSTSDLMTTWAEHAASIDRLLPLARHSIAIFDRDLSSFALEKPDRHDVLVHFLRNTPGASLRIAVQNAEPIRQHAPRLMQMLRLFAHSFHLMEAPPHLANLSDSMLLIDDDKALVRFHGDHARCREFIGEAEACQPYRKRFEEIWNDGCTTVSATTIGL